MSGEFLAQFNPAFVELNEYMRARGRIVAHLFLDFVLNC